MAARRHTDAYWSEIRERASLLGAKLDRQREEKEREAQELVCDLEPDGFCVADGTVHLAEI